MLSYFYWGEHNSSTYTPCYLDFTVVTHCDMKRLPLAKRFISVLHVLFLPIEPNAVSLLEGLLCIFQDFFSRMLARL